MCQSLTIHNDRDEIIAVPEALIVQVDLDVLPGIAQLALASNEAVGHIFRVMPLLQPSQVNIHLTALVDEIGY